MPKYTVEVWDEQLGELETEFLATSLAQAHPKIKEWRGDAIESELRDAQRPLLRTLVDEAAARGHAVALPALALPPAAFKSRLVDTEGLRIITQIGFKSRDDFPFIRILRSSVALGTIDDWSILKARLVDAFCDFVPRSVFFFHPNHLPLAAPVTSTEDYLVAAPARAIAARPPATGLARVTLRACADLAFYPRYKAMYEAVFVARPALVGVIRIETEETLERFRAEGLLLEISVDGKWSGILAADRRTIAGVRGVYMVEIVLADNLRGERLGTAAHQRFAEFVAQADPAAVILGTISERNPWSRQAALRSGRNEIGAWHWLDL